MAIIIKGKTFTATEQVTSAKLHQLVDSATFDPAAADGSTLEVSAGALRVKDAGITGAKLSTTVAIPTGATAVTQAADTNTTAVATCAFAKAEADVAQTAAIAASCQRASNLSDLASASTSRTNLGLGVLSTAIQYVSANQAVPSLATDLTVSHSLGATPAFYRVFLRCTTAELGYAIGDYVDITSSFDAPGIGNYSTWTNSTLIGFRQSGTIIRLVNRTGGGVASITSSSWAVVFKAWL